MFCELKKIWLLLLINYFDNGAFGANILFLFTGGTYSHDVAIWPLAIRLADRNHSITFYSAHSKKPWKDNRIKVINPPKIEEINSRYLGDVFQSRLDKKETKFWNTLPVWSHEICEYIVTDPQKPESSVLFSGDKFDLVILDSVLCDCGHIIAHYHNAKVIVSDSTSILPWFHHIYGFLTESNWIPVTCSFFWYPMNVFNILQNYFEPFYWTYVRRTQFYPKLDILTKSLLKKDDVPSFIELERRAKLIFVNTHVSVELPRSLPPNIIQVGGMQMYGQKNMTIPEVIENFIEAAEESVILLAFGSNVDFAIIPETLKDEFFNAFKNFPKIHFIARGSGARLNNWPKNLLFENWIPQKEILAHPKTVACITHGGLNGIIEATYLGVPLITIPIFGEQDYQSYKLQARSVGIRLELRDLTTAALTQAISDITRNPKYKDNMKKLQAAFQDRPETPLDLATYWTEYVLKYDDLSFMNPIHYQNWVVHLEEIIYSEYSSVGLCIILFLITISIIFLKRNKSL